ncbi:hypothetical protein Dda3937_03007 [Dickeya dadantii 3937]|uniref:Uncharacterized protein n=1 Tax=Dickeya dadantii (strain 3937) TaxID=198628 RepID=E0SJ87_DICD3|nr:hypothetical protein Dda3937_03007 [Dickeya dadantii 3937]
MISRSIPYSFYFQLCFNHSRSGYLNASVINQNIKRYFRLIANDLLKEIHNEYETPVFRRYPGCFLRSRGID